MPRNHEGARHLDSESSARGAPELPETPIAAPKPFSEKDVAAAAERLRDLKETLEWEPDADRQAKLREEIGELESFVERRKKPQRARTQLRVVHPEPELKPSPAAAPRVEHKGVKLSIKEIDATIAELQVQRANLEQRLVMVGERRALAPGSARSVERQIAEVERHILLLQEDKLSRVARIKRDFGTRGATKEETLGRMGESFEEAVQLEKKDRERNESLARMVTGRPARDVTAKARESARDRAASEIDFFGSRPEVQSIEETDTEKAFFASTDEEAWKRAEDSETRRFIDLLHREQPSYIAFTGEEYLKARDTQPKPGFFKRWFGIGKKTPFDLMEQAIENLPNVGILYERFHKPPKDEKFKGVRVR